MKVHGNFTHRKSKTLIYQRWAAMKQRCQNPNNSRFKDYGGRGIQVSRRWEIFENFLEDMGEPPSTDHSLDRKNNNKNYSKTNCRWALRSQQMANTRRNHFLEFKGKRFHISEWARRLGIGRRTLLNRIEKGWSVEKCLTTPLRVQRPERH